MASYSYVKTKIIEMNNLDSGANNILTSQGLSKNMRFFGISGNLLNDNVNQTSKLEFSDGTSDPFLSVITSTEGGEVERNAGFYSMYDDDSYIRITDGLNVKYTNSTDANNKADIVITVIYQ
tara:strand:+ start:3046 stop:3411 length:366 start_codon:yes stop_codon:yes gene_type:complete